MTIGLPIGVRPYRCRTGLELSNTANDRRAGPGIDAELLRRYWDNNMIELRRQLPAAGERGCPYRVRAVGRQQLGLFSRLVLSRPDDCCAVDL